MLYLLLITSKVVGDRLNISRGAPEQNENTVCIYILMILIGFNIVFMILVIFHDFSSLLPISEIFYERCLFRSGAWSKFESPNLIPSPNEQRTQDHNGIVVAM